MTEFSKKGGAQHDLILGAFSRVKDLVRELEKDEKRLGPDFENAQVELKLDTSDVAWYVAYKTAAAGILRQTPRRGE